MCGVEAPWNPERLQTCNLICLLGIAKSFIVPFAFISLFNLDSVSCGALQLNKNNLDHTLATTELVVINFYADWCRFSSILAPIFDEAADAVAKEFPTPGKVVFGKVDCDEEAELTSRFHISKYPTIKVLRNGQPTKREYRGKRDVAAFLTYVKSQLEDPINEFKSLEELTKVDKKARTVIGYFHNKDIAEYDVFRRVAINLKEDCHFHVGFGDSVVAMHPPNQPIIVFQPDHATPETEHETYNGSYASYDEMNVWLTDKCVPLVREITYENAEELTEEGLPFLILFHKPNDLEVIKLFKEIVTQELISEKQNINFLTADGERFAHPLHHLGKSSNDLPLIAIDSFRHMYTFPNTWDMTVPGKLKQFIADLYSGKLHREFHYGPESPREDKQPTTPPESSFVKLAPSRNRYTLLRDEL